MQHPNICAVLYGHAGMAFTPDLYRCGVSFSGIANLADFARAMPPYWAPIRQRWLRRVGDVTSDDALNRRLSPVFHASKVRSPLLIGQGGNDVRVTQVRAKAKSRDEHRTAQLAVAHHAT
jgi:dipeptidyl aminopeptidase/acylaminoacyl peptidase